MELPPAVILAGGLGTRLRETVPDLPKPLAPIAGKPFLHWLLQRLEQQGVSRVILATGYRANQIRDVLGERFGAIELCYSEEHEPLGTGGALRQALAATHDRHAFVLNGDTYAEVDLLDMFAAHLTSGASLTLATVRVPDASRYSTVRVSDGRVREFLATGRPGEGMINGGVYVLNTDLLKDESRRAFSFERDILQARVAELAPLAFAAGSRFIDIGTPDDFQRAQTFFST
jgi:D-glycero-alpha-D-manno-heptose 1-phosphate guanylyltransferase